MKYFWMGLSMVLCLGPAMVKAQDEPAVEPQTFTVPAEAEEVPRNLEREVEFFWQEEGVIWRDLFEARLAPRRPIVDRKGRFRLRIRRYRKGKRRGDAEPIRVELRLYRGKKQIETFTKQKPGATAEFEYSFARAGDYTASFVTFYSEAETYTIALHFEVLSEPPPPEIAEPIPSDSAGEL